MTAGGLDSWGSDGGQTVSEGVAAAGSVSGDSVMDGSAFSVTVAELSAGSSVAAWTVSELCKWDLELKAHPLRKRSTSIIMKKRKKNVCLCIYCPPFNFETLYDVFLPNATKIEKILPN